MSAYFRHYWEAADDSGSEPVADVEETTGGDDVDVAEAPETYTREQLTELLGPRFAERYASAHEGEEAFRQFGQSFDQTLGLVGRGAHLEPQPEEFYRNLGLEPPAPVEQEQEEAPGLWGTPWQRPSSYEEVVQYAQSEDADARRLAWEAVASDPSTPEHVNRWYFNNWASIDMAGATLYSQQALKAEQEAMEQRILESVRAEAQAQYGPAAERHTAEAIDAMIAKAAAQIPGFSEHKAGIVTLMQEREARYPGYQQRFNDATLDERVAELDELTTIAAKRFAPQRKAAATAASEQTDAAKARARTETSRTGGAPDTEQSAAKRKSLEDAKRVGSRVF